MNFNRRLLIRGEREKSEVSREVGNDREGEWERVGKANIEILIESNQVVAQL